MNLILDNTETSKLLYEWTRYGKLNWSQFVAYKQAKAILEAIKEADNPNKAVTIIDGYNSIRHVLFLLESDIKSIEDK